jgi:hypothetical protein
MTNQPIIIEPGGVAPRILVIREQKVILDADLAAVYGVETKRLNEQVKRNRERFPEDFMFKLEPQEVVGLAMHTAASADARMRSQIATASKRNARFLPYAFTEHGALMAATVLNSSRAIQMSVFVVRAFILMREQLLNRAELEKRLTEIEKTLMSHDAALRELYRQIRPLLLPPPDLPRREIGFHVQESAGRYRIRATKKSR